MSEITIIEIVGGSVALIISVIFKYLWGKFIKTHDELQEVKKEQGESKVTHSKDIELKNLEITSLQREMVRLEGNLKDTTEKFTKELRQTKDDIIEEVNTKFKAQNTALRGMFDEFRNGLELGKKNG